ncbi:hypothetical protein MTR67_030505 [Solanum verrucosum]|uniref:DUF4283 domain-containing protein n=1 Tax=Solanum verrucosum TaxID=315347 RepID=A0AAF0U0R1_SOLVR|nr:hypothetical protein MTR67_030505 [Solanum verrucosum]
MARGRGRGKGRPRRETILTLGSANGARIELEGKKEEGEVSINETGAPPVTTKEKSKDLIESWANLFAKNRSVTNGMTLSYIPPQVIDGKSVIQLDKTNVDRETAKWKCVMIVYVLGESPGYNTMHRYISQTWAEVVAPEIFMHDEGYFIVRFQSVEDMIASAIGIPMFADECTTKQTRISFARMLVEVDVTKPLPEEINVMDPTGKTIVQGVKYDWKPIFCQKCQVVGHVCLPEQAMRSRRSPKKVVHKWISKEVVKPVVTTAKEVPRQETSPIAGPSGVITSLQPSPNLTLENFHMLQPTPVRNGFSPLSMLWDERDTIPPDKGGQPITQ